MIKKLAFASLLLLVGAGFCSSSLAATAYYNKDANPGWFAANAWGAAPAGPFNTNWVPGNVAYTGSGGSISINVGQNVALGGLLRASTGTYTLLKTDTPASPVTLSFSGGNIDAGSNSAGTILGTFVLESGVSITGDFTLLRGILSLGGASGQYASHTGAITLDGGTLAVGSQDRLSATSDVVVNSGELSLRASTSIGNLEIDGGVVNVGRVGGAGLTFELASLAGVSGTLRANITMDASTSPTHEITFNQTIDTEFQGAISGVASTSGTARARLRLTKAGERTLTLSGEIENLEETTTVAGGRLYINAGATSFGDVDGSTAIAVASGGALGGTGTISTLAGDHVIVATGGKLIAGVAGSAGTTTYALGADSTLDLTAASADVGWLRFDLGSDTDAGITYSQIVLSGGTLLVGDALEFSDFDFNALAGFGAGNYTLFSATNGASVFGSLGATDFGEINGLEATLSLDANGIYLTVVPEPGMTLLGVIGAGAVWLMGRRRRR